MGGAFLFALNRDKCPLGFDSFCCEMDIAFEEEEGGLNMIYTVHGFIVNYSRRLKS